jgi:hypothetical protein
VDKNVLEEHTAAIFRVRVMNAVSYIGWIIGRGHGRRQGDRTMSRPMVQYTGKVRIQEGPCKGYSIPVTRGAWNSKRKESVLVMTTVHEYL